jgi:hypothetical protein
VFPLVSTEINLVNDTLFVNPVIVKLVVVVLPEPLKDILFTPAPS